VPPAPLSIAGALAAASLAGAIRMSIQPRPLATDAAALVAIGMMVLAVTAIAGVLLSRGRWSRLAAAGVAGGWIALAATGEITGASVAVIGIAAVALGGAAGPWLGRWLRPRPSADGPPPAAVLALLAILATPVAVGITSANGVSPAGWVLAGWSIALALAVARAMPGALTGVRVVHPLATIGAGAAGGLAAAAVLAPLGCLAAAAAWRREVGLAAHPLRVSPPVPIPPELAPSEVLDAAGLDEGGRRRR